MVFGLCVLGAVIALVVKGCRRDKRADAVRALVQSDPVVRTFRHVTVQLNPGELNGSLLKAGLVGNDLIVHSRSFQVGPAVRYQPWNYFFLASDTTMAASREQFGALSSHGCIVVSGQYGEEPISIGIASEGQLRDIWTALSGAGVRPMSPPPTY